MNISTFPGFGYSKTKYQTNTTSNSIFQAMHSKVNPTPSAGGNSYHITIRLGYLYSGGNPDTGQELHMKYDETSTDDDPVMLVEGKDLKGKAFTQKIHLNAIDVTNASTTEMTALNVHLAEQGDASVKSHFSMPLAVMGGKYDVNDRMNYETIFRQWASSLYGIGCDQKANAYMSELQRYTFFKKL